MTSVTQKIGRYEVLGELGRGAMGVVFKARDPFIGRLVAVKTITTGIADNPDLMDRFRREAQAAGNLQHPNIVTIYEMSESEGTPFIAMEYLEGESLEKTISQQLRMPLVHKLGCLVQTCRALDYAHRHGVIHRDVKPANIMVTSEGVVKVVDFGIARIVDATKTQTGTLLGTLYYLSPEQVRGEHADQRSDVWALGAVMYELLASHRPFDGENHAAVLMSILQQEPRSIREFALECPPALESIVQRALRKEPAERYPSMEALLVDLEPVWTGLQREAVQRLVTHGRDLMQAGKLEEASEVLRKSLSLDTGNMAAKSLFDEVNAVLAGSMTKFEPRKEIAGKQNPAASVTRYSENAQDRPGGTLVLTEPMDTSLAAGTRTGGQNRDASELATKVPQKQAPDRRASADPIHASSAPKGGGVAAETILASSAGPLQRGDQGTPITRAQSSPERFALARPAAPQSLAPNSARRAAAKPKQARQKRSPAFAAIGTVLLLTLLAAGYWKWTSRVGVGEKPPENGSISTPASSPTPAQPASPPATSTAPAPTAVPTASPAANAVSLEDQQRQLIDRAREAADAKDYKAAQARLDQAAKLNGPLNPLIKDLRREFSDEAHGAELRQAAQQEQALWARAMTETDTGQLDEAETSLREILTLSEAGRHWVEAARYVDEVLPERRQQEQLWARAQQEANVAGPEHRMTEMKILDQVLAQEGVRQRDARRRRDLLMGQFERANRQRIFPPSQSASAAPDLAQITPLKNAVDQAVTQGDARGLEQLQEIRPKFKAVVDGGGALVPDARDYLNNIIPRAQKNIEYRLAERETNSAANEKYRDAVKRFGQALATQNTKALRSQIQAEFQEIADSGGPRRAEAKKYVNQLIPAALKKSTR